MKWHLRGAQPLDLCMKTPSLVTAKFATLVSLVMMPHWQLSADQQIAGNLEITQQLTLRQDAFMEGSIHIGRLMSSPEPGFTVDVVQETSTVAVEEVVPGRYENQSVFVDDYGMIPQDREYWVEDYGFVDIISMVPDYGNTYPEVWVEPTYDGEGNLLTSGYMSVSNTPVWGIIGEHSEMHAEWQVVGGHMATTTDYVWGVTGSHQEVQNVWVPESRSSYTTTQYGVPLVKFTGHREDTVWSWLNGTRELLEVSNAGLSVPLPGDVEGASIAAMTSTQFEQSYTTPPSESGGYASYGVRMAKDGIESWLDSGVGQTVENSNSIKVKPTELLLEQRTPGSTATSANVVSTRIAPNDAFFGGNIKVAGAILIQPQGDIAMGPFQNGQPP